MWWLLLSAHAATIAETYPPPAGFSRVPADAFGAYVQALALRDAEEPVRTWEGRTVHGHRAHVVDVPLVKGNLQQCADAILRIRAEYLREQGAAVSFHSTSGEPMAWARYQAGERAYADGNRLVWRTGAPASWEQYLASVFDVAGTASLAERETRRDTVVDPGDVVVDPGFPGHAVLIADVATDGERTLVLVVESYMPAQSVHVELGPEAGWWDWADGVALPHWPLEREQLRRWR